jgi:PKD repeat protein
MKALLRPLFVGVLSIAIAATSLVGSSSVALAANLVVTWTFGQVYVGEPVFMTTPGPIDKGSPVYLTAKFTGGAGHGPYTLDVDWGDGTSELYSFAEADPCADPAVCLTVQKRDPYANVGSFNVVVFLEDPAATRFNNLPLSVVTSPPSFTSFALSATEIEVGQAVTATGRFTDETTNDTHTVTLAWGDASPLTTFVLAPGARDFTTGAHTYTAIGNYTVSVIVTDSTGLWTPETATLSVHVALPSNHAPSGLAFDATVTEANVVVAGSFTDPDTTDTHTLVVTWGDGLSTTQELPAGETTFTAPHVYAVSDTYTVTATVTDHPADASTGPVSHPVVVTIPPSGLAFDATATGANVVVTGSFVDPDTTDTHTVTVSWGDSAPVPLDLAPGKTDFNMSHVYLASGTYTVTVAVTDPAGGSTGPVSHPVVVTIPPSGLAFDVTATGANVVVTGSFTDPDTTDTHTVRLSWGDASPTQELELPAGETTFTAPHAYLVSDTYTVTATVTDHPAGATTSPVSHPVVVTVPAESASDVIDEMSSLVLSFGLDRNAERWLLKKLDDLRDSLIYGNDQVCSSTGTLSHVLAFAERTVTSDQFATQSALATKLEAAAGCTSQAALHPKVLKAPTVTTTPTTVAPAPTPKKDTTAKTTESESRSTEGRKPR